MQMKEEIQNRTIIDTDKLPLPKYIFQCGEHNIIADIFLCGPALNPRHPTEIDPSTGQKKVLLRGCFPAGLLNKTKKALYNYYPTNPKDILHVCSGSVDKKEGLRLDIDPQFSPDYLCNAEDMQPVEDNSFQLSFSDTPYNIDASDKYYGKAMINRSKVLKEMARVTKPNGLILILDQIMPVSPPKIIKRIGMIGVTSVPNLDMRILTILKKGIIK